MNILERLKLEDYAQKSMQGTNTRLAEVIRMYETLLGRDGFRKGMDLCLGISMRKISSLCPVQP